LTNQINIADYLNPVKPDAVLELKDHPKFNSMLASIAIYSDEKKLPEYKAFDIAIIGVEEDRNSNNKPCGTAPNKIRNLFYRLYKPTQAVKIVDLGNLKQGQTVNDTYFGLAEILSHLIECNILPVIIGGSQDLTYSNYLAYEKLERQINIVAIDSKLNLGNADEEFTSESYLSKIILRNAKYLFNYTNLGFQSYYVDPDELELMKKMYFDAVRLGIVHEDLRETEPLLRDADLLTFDITAIRQSDAPANKFPSPNGLSGEEACQIAKYAGLSDRLTSFGIYEINPQYDINNQTQQLAAQIIWYFIDGYYQRKNDYPKTNIEQYIKFIVNLQQINQEINFYKSQKTNRWWVEVPVVDKRESVIVSCSYNDYQKASNQEIPDRWWNTYQKIC